MDSISISTRYKYDKVHIKIRTHLNTVQSKLIEEMICRLTHA